MFIELNFEQCIPIALMKIKYKDRSKLHEIKTLKGSSCGRGSEYMDEKYTFLICSNVSMPYSNILADSFVLLTVVWLWGMESV